MGSFISQQSFSGKNTDKSSNVNELKPRLAENAMVNEFLSEQNLNKFMNMHETAADRATTTWQSFQEKSMTSQDHFTKLAREWLSKKSRESNKMGATATTAKDSNLAIEIATQVPFIAYLYDTDLTQALAYESLIESWGYIVDLIHVDDVPNYDWNLYGLILLGHDSGFQYTWGNSTYVPLLNNTGLPIIAIGDGGSSFYSELGLSANYGNGMYSTRQNLTITATNHSIFQYPHTFNSTLISMYNTSNSWMGMYIPYLDASVEVLAINSFYTSYASLTIEDSRYAYWAFYASPAYWTITAKQLFENVISYFNPPRTSDPPIFIDGNTDFLNQAARNNWPGNGTAADPIIIDGLFIQNDSVSPVTIQNTNLYFIISNSYLDAVNHTIPSIIFTNVTNARVEHSLILNGRQGIYDFDGERNIYYQNEIFNNTGSGLFAITPSYLLAEQNWIHDNSIVAVNNSNIVSAGITLLNSINGSLIENIIDSNFDRGIIDWSGNFDYIHNNTIINNFQDGIWFYSTNNSFVQFNFIDNNQNDGIFFNQSNDNTILYNDITFNEGNGITLINSNRTVIRGNTISFNGPSSTTLQVMKEPTKMLQDSTLDDKISIKDAATGILIGVGAFIDPSSNITVDNNTVTDNWGSGVVFLDSRDGTISGNNIANNGANGVELLNATNVNLNDNAIQGNGFQAPLLTTATAISATQLDKDDNAPLSGTATGILIGVGAFIDPSSNITVDNNTISNNFDSGLYILDSSFIYISENTIDNNGDYGLLMENTIISTVYHNLIERNILHGIALSNNTHDIQVVSNNFIDNNLDGKSQALDDGSDNIFAFNFWNDHDNVDNDGDGFSDSPYQIEGAANNQDATPSATFVEVPIHRQTDPIVLFPNGGEKVSGIITIDWKTVANSRGNTVTYTVYYSSDKGESWNLIAANVEVSDLEWDTSGLQEGNDYLIKVIAVENVVAMENALKTEDTSDAPFAIIHTQTEPTETTAPSTNTTTSLTSRTVITPSLSSVISMVTMISLALVVITHRRRSKKRLQHFDKE